MTEFDVVVDSRVCIDVQSVLADSFKTLDVSAFSQIFDSMLGLFLYGWKVLPGLLQNTPREVQLFLIWEVEHYISSLAPTLRIELYSAHLWILY